MQIILVFIVFQFVIFIYFSILTLILKSFTYHCMQSLLLSLMEKALGNSPTLGVKSCCMQSLSNPKVDPTWLMGDMTRSELGWFTIQPVGLASLVQFLFKFLVL